MNPILRAILSMVAGYAVMAALVIAIFTGAYLTLGADWSFRPWSWDPSAGWIALSIVVGLAAAFAGGLVTQRIDGSGKGVLILMGVIVVLGLMEAIMTGAPDAANPRAIPEPSNMEAMQNAVQPLWMLYLNPVLGCIGVFLGSRMLRKR